MYLDKRILRVIYKKHKSFTSFSDMVPMKGIYLYGTLKDIAKTDIVYCTNAEQFGICNVQTINGKSEYAKINISEGIYPCSVLGIKENCIAIIKEIELEGIKKTVGYIVLEKEMKIEDKLTKSFN